MYVPAGYVLFERSSSAVLIYGLRKTVLLKGDPSDYQGVIDFAKASNKDVSRYEQCLERIVAAQGVGVWAEVARASQLEITHVRFQ